MPPIASCSYNLIDPFKSLFWKTSVVMERLSDSTVSLILLRIPRLHSVRQRGPHRPGWDEEAEEAEGRRRTQGRRKGGVTCSDSETKKAPKMASPRTSRPSFDVFKNPNFCYFVSNWFSSRLSVSATHFHPFRNSLLVNKSVFKGINWSYNNCSFFTILIMSKRQHWRETLRLL